MKSNVMQVVRQLFVFLRLPCLVFLVSLLLVAGGYFGIYACDSLNRHFSSGSSPVNPKTFFGHFDGLAALCMMEAFAGELVCVVSFIWIVVATIYWPFRRKHLPEV
jgi:hypothetical protein